MENATTGSQEEAAESQRGTPATRAGLTVDRTPRRLHFRFRGGSKRNPAPSLQIPDKERLASPENDPRAWPCHGMISLADLRRPGTRQSPLSVLSPRLLVEAMTLG